MIKSILPPKISERYASLLGFTSRTLTMARIPTAILAASVPTTPPPMIVTLAAGVPGTPPRSNPAPPCGLSRQCAAAWTAILPATSLIGARSGSLPSGSSTVSYAMEFTLRSIRYSVSSLSAAGRRYVKSSCPSWKRPYSSGTGSLTFTIRSAASKTSSAVSTTRAPHETYPWSSKPAPSPAAAWTTTSCPWSTNSATPSGCIETRPSCSLTSLGTPTTVAMERRLLLFSASSYIRSCSPIHCLPATFSDPRAQSFRRTLLPPLYDDLPLSVELHAVAPGGVQVTEEGVLPAGEREVSNGSGDAYVHPNHAAFHLSTELPRRSSIPREDASRVAVAGFVYGLYSLVEVLHALDGQDGAKDLLLGYLHLGGNVVEDGGTQEEASIFSVVSPAVHDKAGALFLAPGDPAGDALLGLGRGNGGYAGVRVSPPIQTRAHPGLPRYTGEPFHQLVADVAHGDPDTAS